MVTAVEDPLETFVEGLHDSDGVSNRVDLQEPDHITNNNSFTREAVEEAQEKQLVEEVSDLDVESERVDLLESDHSASNNTFTSGSVMSQGRSNLLFGYSLVNFSFTLKSFIK